MFIYSDRFHTENLNERSINGFSTTRLSINGLSINGLSIIGISLNEPSDQWAVIQWQSFKVPAKRSLSQNSKVLTM
ncbi:MAG: hypothetical protein EBU11_11205 [Gammaproteobacteria bacterium]|nr:hypothetical protein [Gammaproteobacteria bacterium]